MSEHPSGLTINLSALVANWRTLAAVAAPAQTAAVVKADAYGLGVEAVARALCAAGCRQFFVATLGEARELQACLSACESARNAEIFLLGGVPAGRELECAALGVMPILGSLAAIERWRLAAGSEAPAPCGVKVDTGMGRHGLSLAELDALLAEPALLQVLAPVLVMSHLACADEPEHPLNQQQLHDFQGRAAVLRDLLPSCRLSLANSCGIYLGADYHFDLVRPGAAIYGFAPPASQDIQPVVSLSLPVMQLKLLPAASSIGYGATCSRPQGAIIAVCAGGYADGAHNILKAQGLGECLGGPVPVVGRISMDSIMFDVSGVPGIERYLDGDECQLSIDVLNERLTFTGLTVARGLLGYELLTSLRAARYQRRYREGV